MNWCRSARQPAAGQIRNSNGPMLVGGGRARRRRRRSSCGIARDDRDELARTDRARTRRPTCCCLSGGVSAGKFDLVPEVLAELGVEQVFHKVALRPGKPLWFGVKRRRAAGAGVRPARQSGEQPGLLRAVRAAGDRGAGRPRLRRAAARHGPLVHDFEYKGGRASCLPAAIRRRADRRKKVGRGRRHPANRRNPALARLGRPRGAWPGPTAWCGWGPSRSSSPPGTTVQRDVPLNSDRDRQISSRNRRRRCLPQATRRAQNG